MKTVLNDLESHILTLTEAVNMAQNCDPHEICGTMHSQWCNPEMMMSAEAISCGNLIVTHSLGLPFLGSQVWLTRRWLVHSALWLKH